MAQKPILF